jgi:hypothetical protein
MKTKLLSLLLGAATMLGVTAASAEDTVKLAVGQRGIWDTSV